MADLLQGKSLERERKPIRGRPRIEEKCPAVCAALEEMLSDEWREARRRNTSGCAAA